LSTNTICTIGILNLGPRENSVFSPETACVPVCTKRCTVSNHKVQGRLIKQNTLSNYSVFRLAETTRRDYCVNA